MLYAGIFIVGLIITLLAIQSMSKKHSSRTAYNQRKSSDGIFDEREMEQFRKERDNSQQSFEKEFQLYMKDRDPNASVYSSSSDSFIPSYNEDRSYEVSEYDKIDREDSRNRRRDYEDEEFEKLMEDMQNQEYR